MLSDKDISKLHKDKEYKKSVSYFRLFPEVFGMIQNGGDFIEVSTDLSAKPQFSVKITTIFWFACRYFRITREVRKFRSNLIELLLSEWIYNTESGNILEECVIPNAIWLDLTNVKKLEYLKNCCIEYINDPENRVLLNKYLKSQEAMYKLKDDIIKLFEEYKGRLESKRKNDFWRSQISDDLIEKMVRNAETNIRSGNLTNNRKRIDRNGN